MIVLKTLIGAIFCFVVSFGTGMGVVFLTQLKRLYIPKQYSLGDVQGMDLQSVRPSDKDYVLHLGRAVTENDGEENK